MVAQYDIAFEGWDEPFADVVLPAEFPSTPIVPMFEHLHVQTASGAMYSFRYHAGQTYVKRFEGRNADPFLSEWTVVDSIDIDSSRRRPTVGRRMHIRTAEGLSVSTPVVSIRWLTFVDEARNESLGVTSHAYGPALFTYID